MQRSSTDHRRSEFNLNGQWFNRPLMKRENVNNKTDIGTIVTMGLSMKRETFCQILVTESCNPTEAYRKAFNVSSDRKATHTEAASRLLKDSNVSARIEALKADISDRLAANVVWDKARFIKEAEANLIQSRDLNQMNPANTSLQLIGRVTQILEDKPQNQVNIGIIDTMGQLPDTVLEQLVAMGSSEPVAVAVDDSEAIEAEYKMLDSEAS